MLMPNFGRVKSKQVLAGPTSARRTFVAPRFSSSTCSYSSVLDTFVCRTLQGLQLLSQRISRLCTDSTVAPLPKLVHNEFLSAHAPCAYSNGIPTSCSDSRHPMSSNTPPSLQFAHLANRAASFVTHRRDRLL